jgi:hypothetical protein
MTLVCGLNWIRPNCARHLLESDERGPALASLQHGFNIALIRHNLGTLVLHCCSKWLPLGTVEQGPSPDTRCFLFAVACPETGQLDPCPPHFPDVGHPAGRSAALRSHIACTKAALVCHRVGALPPHFWQ